jgi:hypothetical protein
MPSNNLCGYVYSLGATVATPGSKVSTVQLRINPANAALPDTYSGTIFFVAAVD